MKQVTAIEPLLPKWTKRVITDTGGRDPLGLSRVSQIITDYLLTGIITTTDRARYYSFYCWALWHIGQEEKLDKYQSFVDAFRRREAAMALATVLHNESTSPVGVVAVKATIVEGIKKATLNSDFRVLPSNQLGGYGQYYAGSLYQLGLTHHSEDGFDTVKERGEQIAKSYHNSIKKTPYIKNQLYLKTSLSLDDLQKSSAYLTIDALSEPFCIAEKENLKRLFFSLDDSQPGERDILRRQTMAQILFMIYKYQDQGYKALIDNIDRYIVYPTYYYNMLQLTHDATFPYNPPPTFAVCHSLWKQFCLQQFVTQAIESLMYAVLETIGGESGGLSIEETLLRLVTPDFFSVIRGVTAKDCNYPWKLFASYNIEAIPDENHSLKLQKSLSVLNGQSEVGIIYDIKEKTPQAALAKSVLLFSVIYAKWRGISNDLGFSYVMNHVGAELWCQSIFPSLDRWLAKDTTWKDTLSNLIETFILNQHDRIMYEKRRLDSCWLSHVDGKIIKEQDYGPRWRSSRHRNVVYILRDLGLLDIDTKGEISISEEGKVVLNKVLKE